MADRTITYLANGPANTTANTERGPTELIWGPPSNMPQNAWIADFIQDPRLGMYFWDDFLVAGDPGSASGGDVTGDFGQWSIFLGSTATITDASSVGGIPVFTPGTAASNHPVAIGSLVGAYQITAGTATSNLQGKLAFEARVGLQSVTASKRDAFVGLIDQSTPGATVPITSGTSTNNLTSTRNLIGFFNAYSGGAQDWGFVYQLASTAPVFVTGLQSLVSTALGSAIVAGTMYKLGFVFDPSGPTKQIVTAANGQTVGNIAKQALRVFVNGIELPAFLTLTQNVLATNFPTGVMSPCVAIMNDVSSVGASTNAGSLLLDWVRVAQNAIT